MIPKQDRTTVRTAQQLERKYDFGQDLTEISNLAKNANRAATNAQNVAYNAASAAADAKQTAESVDNKATNAESMATDAKNTADGLNARVTALEQNSGGGTNVGLSIVNGLLCVTYEGGV